MLPLHQIEQILKGLEEEKKIQKEDFELVTNFPLSRLTTFRTGGPATVLFPRKREIVTALIPILEQKTIPYFVLGNGSNVIAKDSGYEGLILCLSQMKDVCVKGCEVTASAGASITSLASIAQKNNLTGMEFFYGIPGSVGGAVFMNAGAYGGECKDILKEVTFVTKTGQVKTETVTALEMGYRTSIFEKNGAVILSATFALQSGDALSIRQKMEELMAKRIEKQPLEYPSAGSTFKRLQDRFTAQMIDEAGLKGFSVGGAKISEKHAGFVINFDNATSDDIFNLIHHVQDVILEKEGRAIQCEVRPIE